jgi:peptidoglycan/LPS O-acetylase OafA/YrhL
MHTPRAVGAHDRTPSMTGGQESATLGQVRTRSLDGLRGIAAFLVVLSHIAAGLHPRMYFGQENLAHATLETWFATSPLFVAINGSFAVYIFFVLSGYVISLSADRTTASIWMTVVARYLRLALPCAASVLLAVLLYNLRLSNVRAAVELVDHHWIRELLSFDNGRDWLEALKQAAGSYFITGTSFDNAVLWTMQRELIGSVAIYLVFALSRQFTPRVLIVAMLSLGLVWFGFEPHHYLCFSAGTALYLMRGRLTAMPQSLAGLLLVAGLIAGGKPYLPPPEGSFYSVPYGFLAGHGLEAYIWPVGAMLVVMGCLCWGRIAKPLSSPIPQFMGRVSFAVYLVHLPLLVVLMSGLFVQIGFARAAVIYVAAVYLVALAFTILVDEPVVALGRRLRSAPRDELGYAKGSVRP